MFTSSYMDPNARVQNLLQQRSFLDQQLQAMQQPAPVVNNFIPQAPQQYDFNGKWVNGFEEAKSVAAGTVPTIIMDKSESRFYIKNMDGSLNAYRFEPVDIKDEKTEMLELKQKIEELSRKLEDKPHQISIEEVNNNEKPAI